MAHIISRKHAPVLPSCLTQTSAALAMLTLPVAAWAQAEGKSEPATLPSVQVKAAAANPYKAERSASPKFTEPLVNTTQTITVIKKEILAQQAATTLSEALGNTPGITFQMGENGNTQTGDSVFMRGFDTQGSIFVDGIRDLGSISRDMFNIEQVEVVKGPAGADIGRGSPTGYINLSTKQPTLEDAASGSITLGNGEMKRVTADTNITLPALGDGTALRLNFMQQKSGAVDRDMVKKDRWGFAPSLALGLNTPTRAYFNYLHVEHDNRPDGGIPAIGINGYDSIKIGSDSYAAPPVDRSNYYGSRDDYDHVRVDMFTTRIEHDLKPGVILRNTSRLGRTEQRYVLTGINMTSTTGGFEYDTGNPGNRDAWTILRTRQGKDQENLLLTNQTSLNADFEAAGIKHSLVSGIEFIHEKQNNTTLAAVGSGSRANLYHPSLDDTFAPVLPNGGWTRGSTTTVAAYAFDTLKINERFHLNAGLRWEKYKTETSGVSASTARSHPSLPVGTLVTSDQAKSDDLLTWKLGALYKPAPNGSVYAAYGTSQKPPGSDNFALSASADNINNPNLDPSEASSFEIGTKWELFDNRMALTAAIYQSETENDSIEPGTPALGDEIQMGKKTVKGLELGAAGMVTADWQLNLGLGMMETEVNAAPSNNSTQVGQSLAWSPKLSLTSWTTYRLPFGLTVGGGARYVKSTVRNSNPITSTTVGSHGIPSYWVFDAMAAYEINKSVSLQFNLKNVADKFYIASMNSAGNRYTMGAPRTATLTANVQF